MLWPLVFLSRTSDQLNPPHPSSVLLLIALAKLARNAASSKEKDNEETGEEGGDSGEDELNEGTAVVSDKSGIDDHHDDNDRLMETSAAEHP